MVHAKQKGTIEMHVLQTKVMTDDSQPLITQRTHRHIDGPVTGSVEQRSATHDVC